MNGDAPARPVVAVVLAGGTGSRLYPASRSDRPKQFLPLGAGGGVTGAAGDADGSLLARTVARTDFADEVLVSTRPEFADEIDDHALDAGVVVEPAGKDTGPALLYATWAARERVRDGATRNRDPVVVCLPADHHVPDADAFSGTMARGARVAADTGSLVAFGVEPTRPDTGYGYVEPGPEGGDDRYRDLAAFHEKPDAGTAREYVDAGYRWNAGIFAWTPDALLAAARDTPLAPLVDALEAGDPERGFDAVEPVSIDYAVMERAEDAVVVPADFAWDDLGSWDALERVLGTDADGNALASDALTLDASGNVVASDGRHVSLVGVDDLCVVACDDRVLVVPKGEAQRVREVVEQLKREGKF
ncbi:mannose-1-phosphate guanylyltransferase [Halorarum salinum]|uniref:Mannose-1-phosphate guanylyltransferase n=1 Tax=Halorarum salinum TaxID=2743089 RepID=A0A7D5L8D1_9EURY|nr:sugar phosphate nucleotidyltransferase [Halobaculum salinum]QLG60666.1 mannose-1-phosphate guanylyltransferase [Halobaculum salinum]